MIGERVNRFLQNIFLGYSEQNLNLLRTGRQLFMFD
jgi:hypothetical protein